MVERRGKRGGGGFKGRGEAQENTMRMVGGKRGRRERPHGSGGGRERRFPTRSLSLSLSPTSLPPYAPSGRAGGDHPASRVGGLFPLSDCCLSPPFPPRPIESTRHALSPPLQPGKGASEGSTEFSEGGEEGGRSQWLPTREGERERAPFLPSLSPRCTAHSPFPSGAPRPLLPFPTRGEPPPKPRGAKREGATTRPLRSLGKGGWGHS